jgi:hypothetical protein
MQNLLKPLRIEKHDHCATFGKMSQDETEQGSDA